MKFLWSMVAAVAFVGASILPCSAVQQALKVDNDPDSYFEVAHHPSLDKDIGSTITVEAWVNPASDEEPSENHAGSYMIVNKENCYEIARRAEQQFMCALWPMDVDSGAWDWNNSEGKLPMNTWSHVAITWDGLILRMFVNGKFLKSFDQWTGPGGTKGVLNLADQPLQVGHRAANPAQVWNGLIDEVRISKTLRYTESGYAVPGKAFEPDADTVALYHFDEAIDGNVKDASSFGNHGKLIGAKVSLAPVTNGPFKDTP